MNNPIQSDLPVPPGNFLKEVLSGMKITKGEFASKIKLSLDELNLIIQGQKEITSQIALQLEEITGVPAHIWTGLEKEYTDIKLHNRVTMNDIFQALLNEAEFTNDILKRGVKQLNANFLKQAIYFQAFTNLSTGLERIGKICIILDHIIRHGELPNSEFLRELKKIGHDLCKLYEKSTEIISERELKLCFLTNLDEDSIIKEILKLLKKFAQGDRYSNINLISGIKEQDPLNKWSKIDRAIYEQDVSEEEKVEDKNTISDIVKEHSFKLERYYVTEDGKKIETNEEALSNFYYYSRIVPYRQMYVLKIIRYWVEIVDQLGRKAEKSLIRENAEETQKQRIPRMEGIFSKFYADDPRLKKIWIKD